MKQFYILSFLFITGINFLCSQEKLITNAYHRETTSLNGYWKYIVDPYENGFYNYRYEPLKTKRNLEKAHFLPILKLKANLNW